MNTLSFLVVFFFFLSISLHATEIDLPILTLTPIPLKVISTIPHTGYSEGLDFDKQGNLWNALPNEIHKIDPKTGKILSRFAPASKYSESILWLNGLLWNLSYSDNGIYIGSLNKDRFIFSKLATTPEAHAWGITYDEKNVIITGNYSNWLYFLDLKTAKVVRSIQTPISDLEDLAWDKNGQRIWASSFTKYPGMIFPISPKDGSIKQLFQLPKFEECKIIDGIAINNGNLWITGKDCFFIYQIQLPK